MFFLKNSEKKEDLEKILKNLGIDTKKAFRCLNPEHEDKNPSMRYDAKRQKVHCFSCGVDYDIRDVREILEKNSRFFHLYRHLNPGQMVGVANFHKSKAI